MNKVEVYSDWCYIDRLDGKDLKSGDQIKVKWPDGHESVETVITMDKSYWMNDMGSPYRLPVFEAYISTQLHGATALVRLAKSELLCERLT